MSGKIDLCVIDIKKPEEINFILGQAHFIKSVEDLYEAMVNSVPQAKFGIAFCEASGSCKIRFDGNDDELIKLAQLNLQDIAAGHSFIIFIKECFPLHVLNAIKQVPEVCTIYCATANQTKVIVAESSFGQNIGRGILGVIDGFIPKGIETSDERKQRRDFLRAINYKR